MHQRIGQVGKLFVADQAALGDAQLFDGGQDFGPVIVFKTAVLRRAAERFRSSAAAERREAFDRFGAENAGWLDDYALFMALKDAHGGAVWNTWER